MKSDQKLDILVELTIHRILELSQVDRVFVVSSTKMIIQGDYHLALQTRLHSKLLKDPYQS